LRKPRIPSSGAAVGAIATLVLSGGTAYAATGGTFVLGKANAATATTQLTDTRARPCGSTRRAAPLR
jgi:hypothetical protein